MEATRGLEQELRDRCLRVLDRLKAALGQRHPITDNLDRADLTGEDFRRMMKLRQRT